MRDTAVVVLPQLCDGDNKRASIVNVGGIDGGGVSGGSGGSTTPVTAPPRSSSRAAKSRSKMLLRELCVDKDYLEHLTIDPSNNN